MSDSAQLYTKLASILDLNPYTDTQVELLCQQLAIPVHEFFGRYGSKDGLLCDMLKFAWLRTEAALWGDLQANNGPAVERLYGFLDKLDTVVGTEDNDVALMCRQVLGQKAQEYCASSEPARLLLSPMYEELMRKLRVVCEEALQHEGVLPTADARQLGALLYSALQRAFSTSREATQQFHAITNHARNLIRIHYNAHHSSQKA